LLHCFAANLLQNPIFVEAATHNMRSGTARVKEKKDELVNYPKGNLLYSVHGESLKSRKMNW